MSMGALPKTWCLYREGEQWAVGRISEDCGECGMTVNWLANGNTPDEAIKAGWSEMRRRVAERRARTEDYARRKAAGQLTTWELASERMADFWVQAAKSSYSMDLTSTFAPQVNRAFEAGAPKSGDTITVAKWEFSGVRETSA